MRHTSRCSHIGWTQDEKVFLVFPVFPAVPPRHDHLQPIVVASVLCVMCVASTIRLLLAVACVVVCVVAVPKPSTAIISKPRLLRRILEPPGVSDASRARQGRKDLPPPSPAPVLASKGGSEKHKSEVR